MVEGRQDITRVPDGVTYSSPQWSPKGLRYGMASSPCAQKSASSHLRPVGRSTGTLAIRGARVSIKRLTALPKDSDERITRSIKCRQAGRTHYEPCDDQPRHRWCFEGRIADIKNTVSEFQSGSLGSMGGGTNTIYSAHMSELFVHLADQETAIGRPVPLSCTGRPFLKIVDCNLPCRLAAKNFR